MNLYEETLDSIRSRGYTEDDVKYVYDGKNYYHYEMFESLSKYHEYDNGFGKVEINESLKIVFNDGSWLERAEYDGSEWWSYRKPVENDVVFTDIPESMMIENSY